MKETKQMKKLMIAAAAAAMIGGAEAADAQVYDFTATLKTTQCKGTKVSKALANGFFSKYAIVDDNGNVVTYEKGDEIGIRKQASRKIVGVIWGCDCPTIENPMWRTYNGKTVGGYMFWDQSIDDYFRVSRTAFKWDVINRIDAMNKCEGMFRLANDVDGQALYLTGAGFGTVKDDGCMAYVPNISGNLAGIRQPNDGDFGNCVFCQADNHCVVTPLCPNCADSNADEDATVATGTWKIKYNSSMSKKLAKNGYLSQVYTFKKAGDAKDVLAKIEALVNSGDLSEIEILDEEGEAEYDGEDLDITQIVGWEDEDGHALFPTEDDIEQLDSDAFAVATDFIDEVISGGDAS